MAAGSPAAKPYARALHELAQERNQSDTVARELAAVADLIGQEAGLRGFFGRPWVSSQAKRDAALEVATHLGLSPLVRDFLGLVARQGRADHLEAIAVAYRDLVDQRMGRVRARVRTVVPLNDAERGTLAERLGRMLGGKQVVLAEHVDPELLGGFVAESGTYIVDGSLDGQLARVRERLVRG